MSPEAVLDALKMENLALGIQLEKAENATARLSLELERNRVPLFRKILDATRTLALAVFRKKALRKLARGILFVSVNRHGRAVEVKILARESVLPCFCKAWVKIGKSRKLFKKTPFGFSLKFRVGSGLKFVQFFAQDWEGNVIALKESFFCTRERTTEETGTPKGKKWGILTPPHTLFIARCLKNRLDFHGFDAVIISDTLHPDFPWDMYIVLCPQVFAFLPPGEKRICYQLEQFHDANGASRWFFRQYSEILENSLAVLDYSEKNLSFLSNNGIAFPKIHFLPVGNFQRTRNRIKRHDVLFYGDVTGSPRRRELLKEVSNHFSVKIVNGLFEEEMEQLIAESRVVLNLHFYENALLELPRINECLSLGTPVVSEDACDRADYPGLAGAVSFFEKGSVPGMIECLRNALAAPPTPPVLASAIAYGESRFNFMCDRFLLALGALTPDCLDSLVRVDFVGKPCIVLSLPETPKRRTQFPKNAFNDFAFFDGIRCSPAWVGCALSYRFLAKSALLAQKDQIVIMEDDVALDSDFPKKWDSVQRFLKTCPQDWDVFCGIITDLHPEAKIHDVRIFENLTFVFLDRMTGMVFNVYNKKILRLMAEWSSQNSSPETNTVDRYLESQDGLRVVIAFPYLVGHHEMLDSTLWDFNNSRYNEMIATSQKRMGFLVQEFKQHNPRFQNHAA